VSGISTVSFPFCFFFFFFFLQSSSHCILINNYYNCSMRCNEEAIRKRFADMAYQLGYQISETKNTDASRQAGAVYSSESYGQYYCTNITQIALMRLKALVEREMTCWSARS